MTSNKPVYNCVSLLRSYFEGLQWPDVGQIRTFAKFLFDHLTQIFSINCYFCLDEDTLLLLSLQRNFLVNKKSLVLQPSEHSFHYGVLFNIVVGL